MYRKLLCCVCFVILSSSALAATPLNKERLLALAQENSLKLSSLSCRFTQKTSIPLFDEPLVSTGRMLFAAPDSLLWEYLTPLQEGFILTPKAFTRWTKGRQTSTTVPPSQDRLGSFVAQELVTWVTFDTEKIFKHYAVSQTQKNPLTLLLVPQNEQVQKVMHSLEITFTPQGAASKVLLSEAGGGTVLLEFTEIQTNSPIPKGAFD